MIYAEVKLVGVKTVIHPQETQRERQKLVKKLE